MKEQVKKCVVEGCNKPAVGKIHTTTVENDEVKNGYMNYCEEHYIEGIKDFLSLIGERARVDIIVPKNGRTHLFIENYTDKEKAGVSLSKVEVKEIIRFLTNVA